jgi:UPF0042 nucleotide-binding protein
MGSNTSQRSMQLVIISGLSGSGKSVALNMLEDSGYYCIDNLPVRLLPQTVEQLSAEGTDKLAVAIDARSGESLNLLPEFTASLRQTGNDVRLLFLDSRNDTLLRRFAETRRRHPLALGNLTLEESLARERELLGPIAESAARIDTSDLHPATLRNWIKDTVGIQPGQLALVFESFAFKHGLPLDADLVFDVRVLPNPYYDPRLRPQSGRDAEVAAFLDKSPAAARMVGDIGGFIDAWLPGFARDNRSGLTVAIGCTGGQHRSVYVVECLAERFTANHRVLIRHRQLAQ